MFTVAFGFVKKKQNMMVKASIPPTRMDESLWVPPQWTQSNDIAYI